MGRNDRAPSSGEEGEERKNPREMWENVGKETFPQHFFG
jgi:hypothetical protein